MNVSVVVPCRDGAATLGAALASARDQTRPPCEVIVVDDGSTDASAAVAREHGARMLSERRGSAAAARRRGAELARGDALLFLDADDLLGPTALEALAGALETHPGAIARCAWRRLELVHGRWVARPASCAPRRAGQDDVEAWLGGWYHPPCAVLWSRPAYEASGGWLDHWEVNDDGALMLRALVRGVSLVPAPGGASYYRRALPGATTLSGRRRSRGGLLKRLETLDEIADILEDDGRLRSYSSALAGAYDAVAADCGEHADRRRRARDAAARLGGPRWRRACRRASARVQVALGRAERPDAEAVPASSAAPAVAGTRSPAVSVVIPAHDREALLPRALESVLSQGFGDLEVVVVDDASTDGTADVAERCGDARVRCVRLPQNRGASAARNRGLAEARGELIAFLDSDDEWLPDKLALQVALFRERGADVGLAYTGVEIVGAGGRTRVVRPRHRGDVYRALLLDNVVYGGGSNAMVRRGALARSGDFDERMSALEDYDLWLRIAAMHRVDFVDRPLVRYYDGAGPRRSRDRAANRAARARLFERYTPEMRRAGTAHAFLLEGARRELRDGDAGTGRRLVLRALAERPGAAELYPWLPYMLLPAGGRRLARDAEAAVRRLVGRQRSYGPGPRAARGEGAAR